MIKVDLTKKEAFSDLTKKCLDFLIEEGGADVEIGKHYMKEGGIYFIASENPTKLVEEAKWEAHEKYVDLQVALKGAEGIRLAKMENMTGIHYIEERDFVECNGDAEDMVILNPENAYYLFTDDAHMPGISTDGEKRPCKKVCFKIPVSYFA